MSHASNIYHPDSTPPEWTFANPSSGSTTSPPSDFLAVDMSFSPGSTPMDGLDAISREERNMNNLREAVSKDPNWAQVFTRERGSMDPRAQALRSQVDRSLQIIDKLVARGLSGDVRSHLYFKDDGLTTVFKAKSNPHQFEGGTWSLKISIDHGAPFSGERFVPDREDEPLVVLKEEDQRAQNGAMEVGFGARRDDDPIGTLELDDRWSDTFSSALEIQRLSLSCRNRRKGDDLFYGLGGMFVDAAKTTLKEETSSGIRYTMLFVPTADGNGRAN